MRHGARQANSNAREDHRARSSELGLHHRIGTFPFLTLKCARRAQWQHACCTLPGLELGLRASRNARSRSTESHARGGRRTGPTSAAMTARGSPPRRTPPWPYSLTTEQPRRRRRRRPRLDAGALSRRRYVGRAARCRGTLGSSVRSTASRKSRAPGTSATCVWQRVIGEEGGTALPRIRTPRSLVSAHADPEAPGPIAQVNFRARSLPMEPRIEHFSR